MRYVDEDLSQYRKNDVEEKLGIMGVRPVDVMITGATGAGKSTTLNALVQRTVAKIGEGTDPETKNITSYELNEFVRLWDTPGLGDGVAEDKAHIQKITELMKKNYEASDGREYGYIDMVLIVADGSVRDMGTLIELVETIKPYISPKRILVAVNQSDIAMKNISHWDEKNALPDEKLKSFLDERARSVKQRIKESCGIDIPMPVCYSALYGYNVKGLLDILIDKCPSSRRASVKNKDIAEHKDFITNKDPLHLKNGEAGAHIINCFADLYLNNLKPYTTEHMKKLLFSRPFCDSDKIVLTTKFANFTCPKEFLTFAKAVSTQSKYAAEAIEKHGHILCYTDDNIAAFLSGCLFGTDFLTDWHIKNSYDYLRIYIKPEKYTEFLEKFAVTSLIAIPCRENVSINTLEQMIYKNKPKLDKIIPLIYIDMSKVVDDMCSKLGKTIKTLEKGKNLPLEDFDLGDYCVYAHHPYYSKISNYVYDSFYFDYSASSLTNGYAWPPNAFNKYADAIKKWLK